jgi:hypothetical protein
MLHPLLKQTPAVLNEVQRERFRQARKWGEQNHPNGTGGEKWAYYATLSKAETDESAQDGSLTYGHILLEEVYEAMAESDKARLREELIQVAAVAVAWVEKLDRETNVR